jgi:uncharacterized protein with PIN domain
MARGCHVDRGRHLGAGDRVRPGLAGKNGHQRGKGQHPAGLNFGDCFAYELATRLAAPLLFVGDDFSRTDVRAAV